MVIDFQHHYIPVELAKKRGLYSATEQTMLQEGGLPASNMHQRLYDLEFNCTTWMRPASIYPCFHVCSVGRRPSRSAGLSTTTWPRFRTNIRGVSSVWRSADLGRSRALAVLRRAINGLGLRGVTITSQLMGCRWNGPSFTIFMNRFASSMWWFSFIPLWCRRVTSI